MNIENVTNALDSFRKTYNRGNEVALIRNFFNACGMDYEIYSKIDEKFACFLADNLIKFNFPLFNIYGDILVISSKIGENAMELQINPKYFKFNVISPKKNVKDGYESKGIAMESVPSMAFSDKNDIRVLETNLNSTPKLWNYDRGEGIYFECKYEGEYVVSQFTENGLQVIEERYVVDHTTPHTRFNPSKSFEEFCSLRVGSFESCILKYDPNPYYLYSGKIANINLANPNKFLCGYVKESSSKLRCFRDVNCLVCSSWNNKMEYNNYSSVYKFAYGPMLDQVDYKVFETESDYAKYADLCYKEGYFDVASRDYSNNADFISKIEKSPYKYENNKFLL